MEKVARQMREILPVQGIWTVEDFAIYLGMKSHAVQEVLSEMGVKIYHFGREYKRKVFRLEDLNSSNQKSGRHCAQNGPSQRFCSHPDAEKEN